jgi:KUP system potassium uptake protein
MLQDKRNPNPRLNAVVVFSVIFGAAFPSGDGVITPAISVLSAVEGLEAVQVGYCPRIRIVHTSSETEGQIYIPSINVALMLACLGVVLAFRESSGLAGAYGIAVTATMGFTSIIYFCVISKSWGWPLWRAVPLIALFLAFDVSYFGANLLKVFDGGWFTLLVATLIMTAMSTRKDGRSELSRKMLSARFPLQLFLQDVSEHRLQSVYGTAVFMTVSPVGTPSALLHHVKHNHMLHDKVVLMGVRTVDTPTVPLDERLKVEDLEQGFYRFVAMYGFMEKPDAPAVLELSHRFGIEIEPAATTYFLGRESLLTGGDSKMMRWRKSVFAPCPEMLRRLPYSLGSPWTE